ncbi:MAG: hypoxanthine phosphoribosyltransferase, partial [Chloroflexota bacterium]
MPKPYEKYLKRVLIDEDTLQSRIRELGATLSEDYAETEDLLLICILKGGVMFLCDLTRYVDVPHEIDFLAVSSYGAGARSSSGEVRI